jgi:hypothetical protein
MSGRRSHVAQTRCRKRASLLRRMVSSMCRSGRGAVHEGGRLAERPHGAISNRQPFSGTPARRNCHSPAPQQTGRRPRRWTPGGTPARRDVNRQPFSGTPARRDFNRQPLSSHTRQPPLATADGAASADGTAQLSRDWSYAHQSYTNVSDVWL